MRKKDEVEYELKKSISHPKQGDAVAINKIFLHCPSASNRFYTTKLKQAFMRAIQSMDKGRSDAPQQAPTDAGLNEIDGIQVAALLMMSMVDLNDCYDDLKEILIHGGAFLEPGKPLGLMHFEQLCDDDLELILGEYIANFLIPSWMMQAMKK